MQYNRIINRMIKLGIDDSEVPNLDGSITNLTNMINLPTMRITVPDIQDKVENNLITKEQYGPTIDRKWTFNDYEYAESQLIDGN